MTTAWAVAVAAGNLKPHDLDGEALESMRKMHARVFYADSTALEGGDGRSPETAWNSLEEASRMTFKPGDTLLLKRGSVWDGVTFTPGGSGEAGRPITVDCYGEGPLPLLNGDSPVIYGVSNGGATIRLENQSYWTLRNLHVTNRNTAAPGTLEPCRVSDSQVDYPMRLGVQVRANADAPGHTVRGICIENLVVTDVDATDGDEGNCYKWRVEQTKTVAGGGAIQVSAGEGAYIDGVTVQRCWIYNAGGLGIQIVADHWKYPDAIRNVSVRHNTMGADEDFGLTNHGIYITCVTDPVVEYNHLYNQANGIAFQACHNGIAQYNTIQNIDGYLHYMSRHMGSEQHWDGCGLDADALCEGEFLFRNNYIRECYEGAFAFFDFDTEKPCTIVMENNLVHDCNRMIYHQCTKLTYDFILRHNTFVRDAHNRYTRSADIIDVNNPDYRGRMHFEDNVFAFPGQDVAFVCPAAVYAHNLYWSAGVLPEDTRAVQGDPQYCLPAQQDTIGLSYTGSAPETRSFCATEYFVPADSSPCLRQGKVVFGVDPAVFREGRIAPSASLVSSSVQETDRSRLLPALLAGAAAAVAGGIALCLWRKRRHRRHRSCK